MTTVDELVRFDRRGDVGEIALCRPPLNLLGSDFLPQMRQAVTRARSSGVRAVLLRSDVEHFSAGADVASFRGRTPDEAIAWVRQVVGLFGEIEALPVPSVAAVHGYCLGGGLELALTCDLICAADSAALGLVESRIGGIPFAGGMQRVSAKAGTSRALEMTYSGAVYDAETLAGWGIVNRVVAADDLLPRARELADELASGATIAHAAAKRILLAWNEGGSAAAARATIDEGARVMASEDLQNAIESFFADGPGRATFRNR